MVELRERRSVEGARLHAAGAEDPQPRPQLGRGARRERERHHPRRIVRPRRDAVGDAVGDGARLAGARTGEHAHRADQRLGHHPLVVVERGEQWVGCHGHVAVHGIATRGSGPPYQRSSSQLAIDVPPGREISSAASASSARVNQRSSRISTPSGDGGRRRGAVGDAGGESEHQARGQRPRLRAAVLDAVDVHAGLLADLAHDRGLERFARLDESGEQREAVLLPERVGAEEHPVVVIGHEHDHGGIGAREEQVVLPVAAARPSRLHHGRRRPATRAERGGLVPVGERERLGEESGVAIAEHGRGGAEARPACLLGLDERRGIRIEHAHLDGGPGGQVVGGVAPRPPRRARRRPCVRGTAQALAGHRRRAQELEGRARSPRRVRRGAPDRGGGR